MTVGRGTLQSFRVALNPNHGYICRMNATYTAITKQDNGWWIGWIEEVPGVNAQ